MERALLDFISSCAKVASAKHVSINRPITLRVQNPVNGDTQVIVCSVNEPNVEFLPNNVIWLVCNPAANWYNHLLRLTSTLARDGFDNTWHEIMSYNEVFSVAETPVVENPTGPTQNTDPTNPTNPVDPTNNHGQKGDTGPRGEPGPPGERGERGERGETGPEGLRGPQGEKGERGEAGSRGSDGDRGPQGFAGINGEIGPRGFNGEPGKNGERGERGERGEIGMQGPKGETGPRGEVGPPSANSNSIAVDGGRIGKEHALFGQFFSVDAGRI